MKKTLLALFLIVIFLPGCNWFRKNIRMDQLIMNKQHIDATQNPARKMQIIKQLKNKKLLIIDNLLVKDVTLSTSIDYDFCIISELKVGDKKIECFIYSEDDKTTAKLIKGKTRINVEGHFNRFFSILDNYYTKIDIIEAEIEILNRETTAPAAEKK